jgi:inorganic pyrophosphatase
MYVFFLQGDNDPVDVVEIGSASAEMGGEYAVKPLGVYAMVDDGEVDWKVIAIRVDDPKASQVNDVADVEKVFPGELQRILEWFRDYKIPDGKPANQFGYDNQCLDREFALKVVEETHGFYNKLRSGARANSEELSLF